MKLICMSDTHGYHKKLTIPDGDVLIHAGDFSMKAQKRDVVEFAKWVNSLPHSRKIIVAGNHDMICESVSTSWVKETFYPAIYLEHELVHLDDLTIFGSPFSPAIYDPSDWCFDYPRLGEKGQRLWNYILNYPDIDILITHGPPYSIGDRLNYPRQNEDPCVGDLTLYNVVKKIQPKIHIFGHIHEGYGKYNRDVPLWWTGSNRGEDSVSNKTMFYNVSVCTEDYKPTNPITVIDF